jgi:hypothetical protein
MEEQSSSLVKVCAVIGVADAEQAARMYLDARWPIRRGHLLAFATVLIGGFGAWLYEGLYPAVFWLYLTLAIVGVVGLLSLLYCDLGITLIVRVPEIRQLVDLHDREHAARKRLRRVKLAAQVVSWRVGDEELGDLLERLDQMVRRAEPSWRCWAVFVSGLVWVYVNATRERLARLL